MKKKTAVRLVTFQELPEYLSAGWTRTKMVNHAGVDWYVIKRNRDGSAVDTTWGTSPTWTRAHETITKNMKPNKTYFEDDLFKL